MPGGSAGPARLALGPPSSCHVPAGCPCLQALEQGDVPVLAVSPIEVSYLHFGQLGTKRSGWGSSGSLQATCRHPAATCMPPAPAALRAASSPYVHAVPASSLLHADGGTTFKLDPAPQGELTQVAEPLCDDALAQSLRNW